MATETRQRLNKMETDLEAEALSDSKHRGSFHSLKTPFMPFAKDLEGIQDKYKALRM